MADATDVLTEDDSVPIVKAHIIGRDGTEESRVVETDAATRTLFTGSGVVEPPIDPATLAFLFEVSGPLRTNIDAYSTNIDAFGHDFKATLDLEEDETVDKIRQAMIQERLLGMAPEPTTVQEKAIAILKRNNAPNLGSDGKPTGYDDVQEDDEATFVDPSDAEVEARIAMVKREMVREKMRLERFFDFCCVDESFTALRMKTRQDVEVLGNAYWEVLRNEAGDIVQFTYIPGFTMRLMPQAKRPIPIDLKVRATAITETTETVLKRFRLYLQVVDTVTKSTVFFKEFGDPRTVSSVTGKIYETPQELERVEKDAPAATEVIHFKVHNSRTPYGVPRWVSEMLSVLGSRHADEINLAYFENKSIPPMVITVSGGRMSADAVTKIENYIKNDVRGKKNYHKIMIIEAESGSIAGASTGAIKIDIKPLTDAQNGDALFMKYREANVLSIGSVFRLPKLLRGDSDDQNRATAQSALEFAEQQVFKPLRNEFDFIINRKILTDFGVRFWRFESKGPDFSDPNELLTAVNEASKSGYMTPEELREIAGRGFNTTLAKIDEEWCTARPMQLTLAALSAGRASPTGEEEEPPPPPVPPGMMPGKPGAGKPPFGGPAGAKGAPGKGQPPAKPGAKQPPGKPGAKPPGPPVRKAEDLLDLPDLGIPTAHDMAVAAVKLSRFSQYADAVAFFQSHDEENGELEAEDEGDVS